MVKDHDLKGDFPNYTDMRPSYRLAKHWVIAGPFNVEAPHMGTRRNRSNRVLRH